MAIMEFQESATVGGSTSVPVSPTNPLPVTVPYTRDVEASISFQANGGVTHTYAIGEAFGGLFTIDLSATIGAVAREIYIKKGTIINSTANNTISFATIAYFFPTAPLTVFTDASAVTWNAADNALLSAGFVLTFGAAGGPLTNTGANFFNGQGIPVKTGPDGKLRVGIVNNTASAAMTTPVNTTYTFDFAY